MSCHLLDTNGLELLNCRRRMTLMGAITNANWPHVDIADRRSAQKALFYAERGRDGQIINVASAAEMLRFSLVAPSRSRQVKVTDISAI